MRCTLAWAVVVVGLLPLLAAAQQADKKRDARQTAETFLDAAFAGRAKEAAALGTTNTSWSKEDRIRREFGQLDAKMVRLVSLHANRDNALVVTTNVKERRRGREGPLVLTLVRKDGRWLITDVDLETEASAQGEVQRFLGRFPDARRLLPKAGG